MSEPASGSYEYAEVMEQLLGRLQPAVREILLLGAIPHALDSRLAQLLYPDAVETSLKTLRTFRFTSVPEPGKIEYHDLARSYLLDNWRRQNPDRFRQINSILVQEYRRRLEEFPVESTIHASEWLFHTLAVDPANGMRMLANLFEELLESRELGSAERLMGLVKEQEVWIGEEIAWLNYFNAALAFGYYKDVDIFALEKQANEQGNTLLAACLFRLLGQIAVRQQRWADGRKFLLTALKICNSLGDPYYQALTYMNLGDLFQNLVESSGGILIETREFKNFVQVLLYTLSRGPLLLYQLLAEHINALPNLYSMNYQNWVAIHFLHRALRNYRSARKYFNQLKNRRGLVEIHTRIAALLFALGYTASAKRLSVNTLQEGLVKTSPYYMARFEFILGQIAEKQRRFPEASRRLSTSLETFERYGDWDAAGHAALILGKVHEKAGELESALKTYQQSLEAARNGQNILLQSEVAWHLDKLAGKESHIRPRALEIRHTIEQLAFIDRYPGPVQAAFRKLTNYLIYPFIFLFFIALLAGSGITMQIIEGEIRIQDLPPLSSTQVIQVLMAFFLPLFIIWIYQITYFLFGQLVINLLPFSKVDDAQPSIFVLNESDIIQKNSLGKIESRIAWQDVRSAIFADRSLYTWPLAFSSRLNLRTNTKDILIPATTFRYKELEKEIEQRLEKQTTVQLIDNNLSLLHTRWLAFAVVLGFTIAIILDFPGCYPPPGTPMGPGDECPQEYVLLVQPIIQFGLFFASLIFGIISLIRWKLADHYIKKASKDDPKKEWHSH